MRRPRTAHRSRHAVAIARSFVVPLFLALTAPARADICKYLDEEGRVIYSNVDVIGARKLDCPILGGEATRPAAPAPSGSPASGTQGAQGASRGRAATPGNFPRVDTATQKGRDDVRRKVLSDELASEQKSLAEARQLYNNGSPAALPEEKNDALKYRERVGRLRQTVQLHERNVEALRRELGTIR
jgi:hypothetical protein